MDDDVVVRREERGLISVLTMEYRPSTKPWRAVTKEGLARSRSRAMWLLPGRPDHGNPQGSTI
jgi:hypothetical protein